MNYIKEIESVVLDEFSFLQDKFELEEPIFKRGTWITTVSYLSNEIAIEIELDWRDLDVFVLIAKLDKGNLPKGYYVFNGKKCRMHIEEVLQNNLNVAKNVLQEFITPGKKNKQKRNQETILARIAAYKRLLHNHVDAICNAGSSIF